MRIQRLGERAVILRDFSCPAHTLARMLNNSASKPGGVVEAVASYESVGIYSIDALRDLSKVEDWVAANLQTGPVSMSVPNRHVLPVCYEMGEDLADSAESLEIDVEQLISNHAGGTYQCFALGFAPGFAYLGYLPDAIGKLPRLPSPRKRVEPGSVGIAGRQTAVYSSATPGGWNLIGRCPLVLVDLAENYFPIEAGDEVAFRRIDENEFGKLQGDRL